MFLNDQVSNKNTLSPGRPSHHLYYLPLSPGGNPVAGLYDFGDVLQSIRNNETTGEVAKKFLSAAAALSEKSDSNPVFWFWTIPTTVLALGGIVYFVGKFTCTIVLRFFRQKN